MSKVDLGYLEECEDWQVESRLFPSKVGGKPAWLCLENLPTFEQLQCRKCSRPMIFLCQLYAPFEEDDDNFHRTLFVFICRQAECCERNNADNIKVFRTSLPRVNKFYQADPPLEGPDPSFSINKWVQLCELCGCPGDKTCSKCKKVNYCCRKHQVIDWKLHKLKCNDSNVGAESPSVKPYLFSQWELIIEAEEIPVEKDEEKKAAEEYERLAAEGKIGTMADASEQELAELAQVDKDKIFTKFQKRISSNSDQVLRYERGGKPLWIAEKPIPDVVSDCIHCGSKRQFEFQIMPQMLTLLKENDLDWGVIVIYSCTKSCIPSDRNYIEEFVFKQDVHIS